MGSYAVVIVPLADVELAADAAFVAGAVAVVELPDGDRVELRIGFDAADLPEVGTRLGERWVVSDLGDDDGSWWDAWRAGAAPVVIGDRMTIVPVGFEAAVTTDLAMTIDPGQSFGYGGHPTSRLCLSLLAGLVRPGDRVLDVGSGSGVLAIAAALLGAAEVVAVDTDPAAVAATSINVEANAVGALVSVGDGSVRWNGPFAVVVANLLAVDLVGLAPQLTEAAGIHGVIVLSGLLADRWAHVEQAFAGAGFAVGRVSELEGWIALVLWRSAGPLPCNAQNPRYVSSTEVSRGRTD